MITPDRQVRLGHARIRPQNEDGGMRLGQQTQRQFGFGTNRIQAWGIQHHQATLEQRVRQIDTRMTPHRHFHLAVSRHGGVVLGALVIPEAQLFSFFLGHEAGPHHFGQRCRHAIWVGQIQLNHGPGLTLRAQFRQGRGLQTRFDGQQGQTDGVFRVVTQLHRTHGGATCRRRHHATALV